MVQTVVSMVVAFVDPLRLKPYNMSGVLDILIILCWPWGL